jgi:peptidoglycan/xylan/chitin deacetylase (PgdA/CDA1 family)
VSRARELIPLRLRLAIYEARRGARERRWKRLPALRSARPGCRRVVLTFDDGPDRRGTPDVLAALEKADARATFFVLGEQLDRDPSLGLELAERGHEIGLHGFRHLRQDQLSAADALEDLRRAFDRAETATGLRPRWYRPPFGRLSDGAVAACRQLGLEPVYWSTWGWDWEAVPAKRIAGRAARGLEDGAVVLLHDSAAYNPRESATATAEAVPLLVGAARERGLAPVTLGQAVDEAT